MNETVNLPDLGPLNVLLQDPDVTEIMVNSYDSVFIERLGSTLEDVPDVFASPEDLWQVVKTLRDIAASTGRTLNEQHPIVDFRLLPHQQRRPFARVNIVLPPVAPFGPAITILKAPQFRKTAEDLLRFGTWNAHMLAFLRASITSGCTIAVAGNVSSGKTTVLNTLAGMIPPDARVIAVENALELQLPDSLKHIVRLESRPADHEGHGAVSVRELVINALRMRPDRLLLGEVRASEVLDLLQAINTGHRGTMFSLHAASVRDALARLEVMATMHPIALPLLSIRQMLANAIDLITYQEQLSDGKRKIVKIAEVTGMQGDMIATTDLFEFRPTGEDEAGYITGYFSATGALPTFIERLERSGVPLPDDLFTPR